MILKAITAGVAAVVMAAVVPASVALAGFFPADRQTYTCTTPTNCVGADHVQFNSFTNNPVLGDERPFFAGSLNGANVQDRIKVKDGDEIVLRAYVHNNADPALIGQQAAIARNVKIKVLVPTAKQSEQNLVAFVSASNSNPGTINDTMSLYGDRAFTLNYVNGSALFDHRADGVNMASEKVNDIIVGNGASLGDIHGCFKYSGYVTLRVKVVMDKEPETPKKEVKCDLLTAKAVNNSRKKINYTVKATATNGAVINGYSFDFGDGTKADTTNTTIEHEYAKAGTYKTTVVVKSSLGVTDVVERCSATVTISDDKPPVVPPETPKTPETPGKLPETGAGSIIATFLAVTGASTVGYYILARRSVRI